MDITQIKSFIAVANTGSFIAAADKVCVTQSTVSIRIKNLEVELGTKLFERSKQGAHLTIAGKQFLNHAVSMVKTWDEARLSIGVGDKMESVLRIGGQVSLWDGLLLKLLPWMRDHAPEIAIRTEMGYSPDLMQKLTDGSLDIAIMYRPELRPGYNVKQIFNEELILVSTLTEDEAVFEHDYVFVNWGPEFLGDHALNFPDIKLPRVSLDLGTIGIEYLLMSPSSGYFPKRIAEPLLQEGKMRLIEWAPKFSYPAYLVYSQNVNENIIKNIFRGIEEVIGPLAPG